MRIEKTADLPGDPARARDLFLDVASWPRWLPGVVSVHLLEDDGGGGRLFALEQRVAGRRSRQTTRVSATETGFEQQRVSGEPRRWDVRWSFAGGVDDRHTRLHVLIDCDFGMLARLTPAGWLQTAVEQLFRDIVDAAARRLEGDTGPTSADPWDPAHRLPVPEDLQIDRHGRDLVVSFGGRRYRAIPVDGEAPSG